MVRTFSGTYRSRGKRSLSIPLYPEDGPCGEDDDEVADDDDYFGYDTPYDRLADAYGRYRRRRRQPRAPCVSVRGNQISINFSSDGNDTGQRGFEARFRVFRGIYHLFKVLLIHKNPLSIRQWSIHKFLFTMTKQIRVVSVLERMRRGIVHPSHTEFLNLIHIR